MAMQTAPLGATSNRAATGRATAPTQAPQASLRWIGASLFSLLVLLAMATTALAQNQQPGQGQGGFTSPPQQRLEPTGESFGDWRLICSVQSDPATAQAPQTCFISERVIDPGSQKTVLVVTVGYFRAGGQPGALISMPLGIPLSTGVQISVDGRTVSTIPFEVCRRDGCQAFMPLTDSIVSAFKAGNAAAATVRTGERGAFNVPFSLQGFTAGFARVK